MELDEPQSTLQSLTTLVAEDGQPLLELEDFEDSDPDDWVEVSQRCLFDLDLDLYPDPRCQAYHLEVGCCSHH